MGRRRPRREASSTWSTFGIPDYQRYWTASLTTHMSFQMQAVVLGWHMLERTDSASWVGLVGAAYGLPMLLFASLVGILADRTRRQNVVAAALTMAAGGVGVIALLTALRLDAPWQIVALSFVIGSGFTLYAPARLALLPNLLPPGALLRASTVEYSSTRVVGFFGPALAGFLVEFIGVWRTLLLQVVLFGVAVWIFLRTGRSLKKPIIDSSNKPRPLRGVQDAWAYLRTDPPLFALFVLGLVVVPMGMAYLKLLPVFARDVLGEGASALGAMVGVVSLGTALSGFAIAVIGDRFKKGPAVLVSAMGYGATLTVLGFSRDLVVALSLLLTLGLLAGVFLTLTSVLLQSRVIDEVRGRVMALYGMVWGTVPLFTLLAGMIADRVGVSPVISVSGAVCAIACGVMAVRGSVLREL